MSRWVINFYFLIFYYMARTSTYLNFRDQTEQAFEFYRTVFGGEFIGGIHRMGEVPPAE
jgi:PhnB protein